MMAGRVLGAGAWNY
jgi:carbonic anhydrase